MFLIGIIVFVSVFIIVLCGILFYQSSKDKADSNEQYEVNRKISEYLQAHEFKVSKIFYITDSHTFNKENSFKKMIVVDNENKKLCLINYQSKKYYIIDFDEYLNYELYENGGMVTNGEIIGGVGIGVFGAETNGNCKDLKLIIRIKSLTKSQVVYDIISNYMADMGINKSSPLYRGCIFSLQEVISFFEVIKNDNLQNGILAGSWLNKTSEWLSRHKPPSVLLKK